jgi:drug/metabolite transporter (DMT)-like permease
MAFVVAWISVICLRRRTEKDGSGPSSLNPWIPALVFAVGESGSTAFFLLATHYISAAEANLILFLWPGLTLGAGALLGLFCFRARHIVGIALGFMGAAILMEFGSLSFSGEGIGLALLGAVSWAAYCVFRLKWKATTEPFLARGFAISAALCGATHLFVEPSAVPSIGTTAAIAAIGIVPTALGTCYR